MIAELENHDLRRLEVQDMRTSAGWKIVREEAARELRNLEHRIATAYKASIEDIRFMQGQADVLLRLTRNEEYLLPTPER